MMHRIPGSDQTHSSMSHSTGPLTTQELLNSQDGQWSQQHHEKVLYQLIVRPSYVQQEINICHKWVAISCCTAIYFLFGQKIISLTYDC